LSLGHGFDIKPLKEILDEESGCAKIKHAHGFWVVTHSNRPSFARKHSSLFYSKKSFIKLTSGRCNRRRQHLLGLRHRGLHHRVRKRQAQDDVPAHNENFQGSKIHL
jgi:hypothetical protein